MIGDEDFGPTDEEFGRTVERARMLNPSSSAATVIPLRPSNAELDAEVIRLDAKAEAAASEPEGVTLKDFVAYKPTFLPKGTKAAPSDLASKDAALINAFHRKGFKDVVLMNRSNPNADYNVRPYKGWLEQGRVVRKGQKGVRGLFHLHQTDPLPSAKPGISAEQKQLFANAKQAFKAKKAKPQATLPLA